MIYQSDRLRATEHCDTTYYVVTFIPVLHIGQRLAIDDAVILYFQSRYGIDGFYHPVVEACDRLFAHEFLALAERLIYLAGRLPFLCRQLCITAAHGQAALLAHNRTGNNLKGET